MSSPLYPQDLSSVKSRRTDIRYALEVNRGWFEAHNLQPGAQLDLEQLANGLKQRGFDPEPYIAPPAE